jgi:hypothetical protein
VAPEQVTVGVLERLEGSEPQAVKAQGPTAFTVCLVDGAVRPVSVFAPPQANGKNAASRLRALMTFFMVLSFEKADTNPDHPELGVNENRCSGLPSKRAP